MQPLYDIKNYKNYNITVSEEYHIINHKLKNLYNTCTCTKIKKRIKRLLEKQEYKWNNKNKFRRNNKNYIKKSS